MHRRFLRNQDDGQNGGNPPEPQAQGADSGGQQYITAADLKEFGNSMFANMRRMTDQMNQQRTQTSASEAKPPKGAPAEPAPSVPDHAAIRQRYDALSDELSEYGFSKEQKARVRSNFDGAAPDNVGEWVKGEAALFGVVQRGAQNAQTQTQNNSEPIVQNPRPTSNGGAPAEVAGIESNDPAWTLSPEAVASEIRKRGMVGAGQVLKSRLQNDMRGRSFSLGARRK